MAFYRHALPASQRTLRQPPLHWQRRLTKASLLLLPLMPPNPHLLLLLAATCSLYQLFFFLLLFSLDCRSLSPASFRASVATSQSKTLRSTKNKNCPFLLLLAPSLSLSLFLPTALFAVACCLPLISVIKRPRLSRSRKCYDSLREESSS